MAGSPLTLSTGDINRCVCEGERVTESEREIAATSVSLLEFD